ncbi:MAG: ferredoxin-type protein NapH, partial [Clostridiales bacterium]|nr:ferredoxin-type protein NapH [Clostridiales bacterium]
MKRQQIRKLLLTISFLLFPITLFYFSPALIINAALSGIINGSFIVFLLLFILSIPFSRLYCAYLCPAGGLQACSASINGKLPKQGWRNYIKYVIFSIWIGVIIACYFIKGSITGVDFFFETTHGISVTSVQSYVIYYGIVILIFLPSVLFGKQLF